MNKSLHARQSELNRNGSDLPSGLLKAIGGRMSSEPEVIDVGIKCSNW